MAMRAIPPFMRPEKHTIALNPAPRSTTVALHDTLPRQEAAWSIDRAHVFGA